MELHADDTAFVRAPAIIVDTAVVAVERWPQWWPDARVLPRPATGGASGWLLDLRRGVGRRLRCELRPQRHRPAKGLEFTVRGDLVGRIEFWYEPVAGGTIVHHLIAARTTLRRPDSVLRDYRRTVRHALAGLKDRIELQQRVAAGLPP